MSKKVLTFGGIGIERKKFYRHKSRIFFKDVDIEKVLVSKKISSSEINYKNFIGYLYNDHKVKPLYITLQKVNAYVKGYDGQWWRQAI